MIYRVIRHDTKLKRVVFLCRLRRTNTVNVIYGDIPALLVEEDRPEVPRRALFQARAGTSDILLASCTVSSH